MTWFMRHLPAHEVTEYLVDFSDATMEGMLSMQIRERRHGGPRLARSFDGPVAAQAPDR